MSGKPASRISDGVAYGVIVQGSRTVLIGTQGGVACSSCPGGVAVGNPVNPMLGAKVQSGEIDLALPAPLPFILSRDYSSYQTDTPAPIGLLGPGWWLPAEVSALQTGGLLTINDSKGRSIRFDPLAPGEIAYSRSESLWIVRGGKETLDDPAWGARLHAAWHGLAPAARRDSGLLFLTNNLLGPWWIFGSPVGNAPDRHNGDIEGQRLWQLGLANHFGRQVLYQRASQGEFAGLVTAVQDSAGRGYALDLIRLPGLAHDGAHGWGADSGIRLAAVRLVRDPHGSALPTQPLVRYDYTRHGELAAVHGRDGQLTRQFHYHPELVGRITAHAYAGQPPRHYLYDPQGRVIEQTHPGALSYRFDYQGDSTVVTDNLGRIETYHFAGQSGLRRLVRHERADGSATESRFDRSGRLISQTDAMGRETRYELDVTSGNVLGVTLPDGRSQRIEYNQHNQISAIHGADGLIQRIDRDEYGRLSSETDALGHRTHYHYADRHRDRPDEIEDAQGGRKKLQWDALGQLTAYTDCSGATTTYQRDRWGNLTQVRGEENLNAQYEYDPRGRIIGSTDALGHKSAYRYDAAGALAALIYPDGSDARFERDPGGQLTAYHYAGRTQRYHYDIAGRLTELTNENGARTLLEYDAMDRLILQSGFDGRTQHYTYNAAGQISTRDDAGLVCRYHYDKGGRLSARTLSAAGGSEILETFIVNSNGQLAEARHTSAIGANPISVRFERDRLGRITAEELEVKNSQEQTLWQHRVTHQYDALGNERETGLDGLPPLSWQTYGSGHLHGVVLDGRSLIDFERDKLHRETERRFHATTEQRRYNPLSRLHSLNTHSPLIGGQFQRQHHYDVFGQLTRIDTAQGPLAYHYDPTGRLIEAQLPGQAAQTYRFDAAGNRLFHTQAVASEREDWAEEVRRNLADPDFNVLRRKPESATRDTVACWPANRIDEDDRYRYQYDIHGNLTLKHRQGELHLYTYDSANRLIQYACESPEQVRATNYLYDPFGRRIAKQIAHADAQGQLIGEVRTTWYGWDGDRLVLTQTDDARIHTVYQPNSFVPLLRIESGAAVPQSLAQKEGMPRDADLQRLLDEAERELKQGKLSAHSQRALEQARIEPAQLKALLEQPTPDTRAIHLYHCDHLGTPIALINEEGGVDWQIELDAWGNTLVEHNPNDLYQPIRFQGQHHDAESGLHYNRYRFYDPGLGRYITQDPIGLTGGINLYAYANNPTGAVDPWGLECGQPITEEQLALAREGKFMEFWRSRHLAGDPVARTALTGWGDPGFVNASWFERGAAKYTWWSMSSYISANKLPVTMEQIGGELALAHASAVMGDTSGTPNLLSPTQVANYHHEVFARHNIPPYIFGGTQPIPGVEVPAPGGWQPVMFDPNTYSNLWCEGCDSTP